jgi:hypothetical protein
MKNQQTYNILVDKPVVVEKQDLIYGNPETYKYKMSDDILIGFSSIFNRKTHQTMFLFQLVDGNIEKLWLLEMAIKNRFYFRCPENKEEVEKLMAGFKLEW